MPTPSTNLPGKRPRGRPRKVQESGSGVSPLNAGTPSAGTDASTLARSAEAAGYQLFGDQLPNLLNELKEVLAA